jgi:hypothetical protein
MNDPGRGRQEAEVKNPRFRGEAGAVQACQAGDSGKVSESPGSEERNRRLSFKDISNFVRFIYYRWTARVAG